MKKAELIIPAGSLEKLKTAILYGADAVYAGAPSLSLRTKSTFTLEELIEGAKFVHKHKKRIYLALNLFTHNKDIEKLPKFLEFIKKIKPDGLIISDPGVFQYMRKNAPKIELHVSTQANICSWLTVKSWQKMGAKLCVLGREVTFEELKEIRKKCKDMKLEIFVHGAMCMSYSGRCLISNFLAERGANQGSCAHCCRWTYKTHLRLKDGTNKELIINDKNKDLFDFLLEEEFRPGDLMPIEEFYEGSHLMNSKDLCLMPKLDQYLKLGIDSFKIEGRNKTNYYVAVVTHAYRQAIDDWYQNPKNWNPNKYMDILYSSKNRGYTLAFHEGRLTNYSHNYWNSKSTGEYESAGFVRELTKDDIIFEARNTLTPNEIIEFISPLKSELIRVKLPYFIDAKTSEKLEKVNPGQNKAIKIPKNIFKTIPINKIDEFLPVFTVARKIKELNEADKKRIAEDKKTFAIETKFKVKTPKKGISSCCGKGCNGCMIFWNDPKFAKARKAYFS